MFDTMINKSYDLYVINAKTVEDRLKKTYKMSKVRIQAFNDAINLPSLITEIRALREEKKRVYRSDYMDEVKENIRKEIKSIINNKHVGDYNRVVSEMGYELMPIAVSVAEKAIMNENAEVELLDGFRRMFFVEEVPDKDLLVKV